VDRRRADDDSQRAERDADAIGAGAGGVIVMAAGT